MLLEHVFLKVACDVILEVALASIKERNISNKMSAVVQIALLSLQCIALWRKPLTKLELRILPK